MTTTTAPPTPDGAPAAPSQRRLALGPADPAGGYRDGTWWPRTGDLAAEAPDLVAAVERGGPRVDRLTHHLGDWEPGASGRVDCGGHPVHLDGYVLQHTGLVTLVGVSGWPRTCLTVLPPGTEPAEAARRLDAVASA